MNIEYFKPNVKNIKAMQDVVRQEVANGIILPRDENDMATNIRSYTAAKLNSNIIGFVALHIHTPLLAEIRSLVVSQDFRDKGVGHQLINHTIDEALRLGLKEILVLTYKDKLFEEFGFNIIDKELVPHPKIWADCIKCQHFPKCDEIALLKKLS